MLRSLAVPPMLLMLLMVLMTTSLNIDARTIKVKIPTTTEPTEDTTFMHLPDGTITVDIDADEILTTSPESETFSEPSPLELTEEPLPDSVIRPHEKEQAQEVQAQEVQAMEELTIKPIDSEKITTEETTTEKKISRKSYKFGSTTSMPMGFSGFYTVKPEYSTTENIEDTTEYEDYTTEKHHHKRPARPARLDMEMSENRMETTTDVPALQNKKQDYFTSPSLIMTTDSANSVPTQSPLFRFFTASTAIPLFMEPQPETTTNWPESTKEEATTMPVLMETTEVLLSSSTQATESITEPAKTNTIPAPSSIATTEPEPLTARMELYLNIQYPVSEYPETTTGSRAPETVPETTILSISAPETTTSTTSAPEIITSTSSAPETTTSTTNTPEIITSTSSAPEITTSTTSSPETIRTPETTPSALETTTSTTSALETTTSTTSVQETTTSTTSAPETTTSTTRIPETTTSTTSAPEAIRTPETTTLTTSAPETTTSTFSAPLATIKSTRAPETTTTTTTTTPRPVLTRAPRVERIFNSDGVEVLYGYSSVVRTNRS